MLGVRFGVTGGAMGAAAGTGGLIGWSVRALGRGAGSSERRWGTVSSTVRLYQAEMASLTADLAATTMISFLTSRDRFARSIPERSKGSQTTRRAVLRSAL